MTMTVRRGTGEARDNNERAIHANYSHHVAQHVLLTPFRCGLGLRLGETEIESAREELISSIKAARLQQFLSANHTERLKKVGADDVLSTFTSIEGEVSHPRLIAASETRNQRGVFIVRMRAGVHGARSGLELTKRLAQTARAVAVNAAHLRSS